MTRTPAPPPPDLSERPRTETRICVCHDATHLIYVHEAEAATAAVPLDVERLALAFDNLHLELVYVGPGYLLDPIPDLIAAEYARLSASAGTATGDGERVP